MVWTLIGKWIFACYASHRLRKAQNKLARIKLNNYRREKGLPPIYGTCEKISRWFTGLFRPCTSKLKRVFCPCCIDYTDEENRRRRKSFYEKLWINGTRENYIGKCTLGFIVGVFLSLLLWRTVHADPINISLTKHKPNVEETLDEEDLEELDEQREPSLLIKLLLIFAGILLTLALTFSEASRCILILALSQFFTNKGRAALLAYTLILALSGPAKNTTTNMEILTESLACGQQLLKDSIGDLFNFVKQPFTSFQKAIGHIIDGLQGVFGRMKTELQAIFEAVKDIVSVIKSVYNKLKSIVDICDYKFGTPYERCIRSFDAATADCEEKLGEALTWMCSPVDAFSFLCTFTKVTDKIVCWFPSLVKEHVFDPIVKHFKAFAGEFKKFFDVRLNITYKFDMNLNRDKTLSEVFEAMKGDILGRCDWLFEYFSLLDLTLMIPLIVVLYKAFSYRWKFLNSDNYDNYYLSSTLIKIDIRRNIVGGESIFPLRNREANLYVETLSWRLVKAEKKHRKLALAFVTLAAIQISTYLFMDYVLYRFMEWIRVNAAIEYKTLNDPLLGMTATVEGDGFLASMYRSIIENLNPVSLVLPSLDTRECLPIANKPNYRNYFWISVLLLLCFMLAFFEPYGLRLRHLICGWVYPNRVREREKWLYTHILTTRDSFLQFAKKTIRAKVGFRRKKNWKNKNGRNTKDFDVSCKERLIHRFPILRYFFDPTTIKCFICGTRGNYDDRESFIDCMECNTIYCKECLEDMSDQCVICSKALDSEISSEGEDDEELEVYRDDDDKESLIHS